MEDETVVEAVPSIGLSIVDWKNLRKRKTFQEMTYVAERICGICLQYPGPVNKLADAANAFRDIGHFLKVFRFRKFFQSTMDKPYRRNGLYNGFVFHDKIKVYGFGKNGCCGPKGIIVRCAIMVLPRFLFFGAGVKRRFDCGHIEISIEIQFHSGDRQPEKVLQLIFITKGAQIDIGNAGYAWFGF